MAVLHRFYCSSTLFFSIHYRQKVRAMTNTLPEAEEEERTAQIRMEESFTIHLGKNHHISPIGRGGRKNKTN